MPESVTATAGATVGAPGFDSLSAARTPTTPTNDLGKDEFLKLLVAQLKYQDPLEPTSSDEFIATSAQFTIVEKLDELTKQGANTALVNSLTTASSLIGREITTNGIEGPVTATVQRSEIGGGEVLLVTENGSVRLDQIVSVGSPAADNASVTTAPGAKRVAAAPVDPVSAPASADPPSSPPTPEAPTTTEAPQVGEQ